MILDPHTLTISHDGKAWVPTRQQARLVVGMSAQVGLVWSRQKLQGMMASSAGLRASVNTQISHIRRAFWERWEVDPIQTRYGLGYAWMTPVTIGPPQIVAADEFRFRSTLE